MLASTKYLKREILDDGIVLLTFDRPDSTANIFDQPTFDELNEQLHFLETEKSLGGLIIWSAKPKIYIAGADLKDFTTDRNAAHIAFLIEQGQKTFERISRLPFVTVAAIHGVALGGGFEIALACDYRVASSDAATKVGLPETLLGILPAWGGSTRLPRLIGFQKALDAILTGRQFPAKLAAKLGMVDAVAYPERIIGLATGLIRKSNGKKRTLRQFVVNRPPISRFIKAEAEKTVLAKTRGNYPAQLKALEVTFAGLTLPHEQSLANEKDKFLELALGAEAKNLIQVFFLQERAKKLRTDLGESGALPIKSVRKSMVIGAGVMGAGIAQWLSARGGIRVLLKDVDPSRLAKGMQSIDKLNRDAVRRHIFSENEARNAFDRIVPVYEDVPLRDIDLVIEAAIEELQLKQKIFAALETKVSSQIVLASNTSALSIDAIASSLQHPERVVGIHFFNPVHRMQLVEIVHGPKTSALTVEAAIQFVKSLGKLPVLVRDSPGFLVNRILLPYMVESMRLFREGHRLANIDRLMLDFGMPMGPLRLTDEVGFDVAAHVARELESRLPYLGPLDDTLDRMIAKGWLGRKSGKGFYQYVGGKESANPELGGFQPAEPTVQNEGDLRDRLVLIMVNEAARMLEEKVVEAPEDVDFGMIMGTGWAPFRGGPLHFADALGVATVVSRLNNLRERIGTRFAPCSLLSTMAEKGETFYPRDKGIEITENSGKL